MMNARLLFLVVWIMMTFGVSAQSLDLSTTQWQSDLDVLTKKLDKTLAVFPAKRTATEQSLQALQNHLPSLSDLAIMIEMNRIVASLNDGHTELNLAQTVSGLHKLPVVFYFFGSDLYILAANAEHKSLLGKKVIHFDNSTTSEAFEKLKPLLSHDNEQEFKYAAPTYLAMPEILHFLGILEDAKQVKLTFESGETATIQAIDPKVYAQTKWISARDAQGNPAPLYLQHTGDYYWYTYLEGAKTLYFQYNRVNNQKGKPSVKKFLKAMFAEIDQRKPEKMVIDLRLNNGGNYHRSEPLLRAIQRRPWLNQAGKLFIINGPRTFSAAMVTTVFLKRDANGIIIGEPSRSKPNGSDNDELATMPNSKLRFSYTNKVKDHWRELGDALYIPVDVPLENTIEDYIAGRDRLLEYIINQ